MTEATSTITLTATHPHYGELIWNVPEGASGSHLEDLFAIHGETLIRAYFQKLLGRAVTDLGDTACALDHDYGAMQGVDLTVNNPYLEDSIDDFFASLAGTGVLVIDLSVDSPPFGEPGYIPTQEQLDGVAAGHSLLEFPSLSLEETISLIYGGTPPVYTDTVLVQKPVHPLDHEESLERAVGTQPDDEPKG